MGEKNGKCTGGVASSADGGLRRSVRGLLPRPEALLLLLGLVWTLGAKLLVLRRQDPEDLVRSTLVTCAPDVLFFSVVALLIALAYALGGRKWIARLVLIPAAGIMAWSTLNAAWLIATGAQLQPGVLNALLVAPAQFWPTVETHLRNNPLFSIPIGLTLVAGGVWLVWRFVVPVQASAGWKRVGVLALMVVVSAGITRLPVDRSRASYAREAIGFSSHWYAVLNAFGKGSGADVPRSDRVVARAGDRTIGREGAARPNVVVVFLESVSHEATSFGNPERDATPYLVELASEGLRFTSTRIPVPHTSKAQWAALTGSSPDTYDDFVEAALADEPYESLATILGEDGYRSAFMKVAKGSFEAAPGLAANLGFDHAWFRENMNDKSGYLGYLAGDDFRIIDPVFEWVEREESPFLLVLTTATAHDPYELPEWYEHERKSRRRDRYLDAVRFTDDFLRELCAQLDSRGMLDNTLLCVMGDHGEVFRPEARRARGVPFEEVIRVPWVVRWPEGIEAGAVGAHCSQLDMTPTLLSILGYDVSEAGFEGIDARDPPDRERRFYFASWFRDCPIGYFEDGRKLIYSPYTGSLMEFDLEVDPEEKQPVVVTGSRRDEVIADVMQWYRSSRLDMPARRFRQALLYEHWQTFCTGRDAKSYYVP